MPSGALSGNRRQRTGRRLAESLPEVTAQAVVYGGDESQARSDATAVPLAGFGDLLAALDTLQG